MRILMQVLTKLEAHKAEKERQATIRQLLENLTDYGFLERASKVKS